jgi:hypothetical protein
MPALDAGGQSKYSDEDELPPINGVGSRGRHKPPGKFALGGKAAKPYGAKSSKVAPSNGSSTNRSTGVYPEALGAASKSRKPGGNNSSGLAAASSSKKATGKPKKSGIGAAVASSFNASSVGSSSSSFTDVSGACIPRLVTE